MIRNACLNLQRLNKKTLLAILPSYFDPTYVIDSNTGEKIRIDSLNNGPIVKIQLVNNGRGYTSIPDVIISGGNGSGATAVAVLYNEQVNRIDITNAGQGYTKFPNVTITGGGGSEAYAVAYIKDLSNIFTNGIYRNRYKRIETLYPRNILLSHSNWDIKSFNPRTREVCISFNNYQHNLNRIIPCSQMKKYARCVHQNNNIILSYTIPLIVL